jgi:Rnl2 family RNA ligase
MTSFTKYSTLSPHYHSKTVAKIRQHPEFKKYASDWVVTEKVHGSNFSFVVTRKDDNMILEVAKRTAIIEDISTAPYKKATATVRQKYDDCAIQAYDYVCDYIVPDSYVTKVAIFGELFGGEYVRNNTEGTRPIFTEVLYCPHHDFYAFDIFITYDNSQAIVNRWLSFDEAEKVFLACGFNIYAKALVRGSFEECMDYNIAFTTTIPKLFDLEPIAEIFDKRDHAPNICEGVVVRPNQSFMVSGERAMFKKKNLKFIEKISSKVQRRKDYVTTCWEELLLYITKARLSNVISKIGEDAQIDELVSEMNKDVKTEFIVENEKLWSKITEEEQQKLDQKLNARVLKFVKRNYIK